MPKIKVSVIVPTYRSGDGLRRVIESLDSQTLDQAEFESIFIDDGSPDDTYERLLGLQRDRPNMSVDRIENSGWSSRPRNVAIERARGEYVLFMDHDDYLHPEALAATYAFALANDSDVVNPKESKTGDAGWGLEGFTQNVGNARETRGIDSLMPMMPHKLYRRSLLLDHGIRFPEGRRMFWEDVCFNVLAYRHASVISVLAGTPVYRWVNTGENNSSSYGPEDDEFWDRLDALFAFIDDALPGAEYRQARDAVIAHVFRTRVLGRLYPWLAEAHDADPSAAVERARAIAARHVSAPAEELMGMRAHAESAVLRDGDLDSMSELRAIDSAIVGLSYTDRVEWEGRALMVGVTTTWGGPERTRLELDYRDGRIVRRLPERLERIVPLAARDVTDGLRSGATMITLRARHEQLTWPIVTESDVRVFPGEDRSAQVVVQARAIVDPKTAALGGPLADSLWDVHAHNTMIGVTNDRAVRSSTPPRVAFIDGMVAIAYANKSGHLSVDLAQQVRNAISDAKLDLTTASVRRVRRHVYQFTVDLLSAHVVGQTELRGKLALRAIEERHHGASKRGPRRFGMIPRRVNITADSTGTLSAGAGTARLAGTLHALPGAYALSARFGKRMLPTSIGVRISRIGRASLFEL